MRFVFVMDTLDRVNPDKDTSFAFIQAAGERGHTCFHCLPSDLSVVATHGANAKRTAQARVRTVATFADAPHIRLGNDQTSLPLDEVDAVFIRKDPPFDQAYLYATLLLEHARGGPLIVNDPRGLRDANEKLYTLNFPEHMPRTRVTADRDEVFAFLDDVGGSAVIKPLDGAGGAGVLALRKADKNARAIVDLLTAEGTRLAMVQEFLPAVTEGDKRILLLDGEPLGAILRVPRGDDLRSNMHVGGSAVATEVTAHEAALVKSIAPRLRADGLYFVGLDVIGGRLTEVNVTSPTGIQELGRFNGTQPAHDVVAWVEQRRAGR